MIAEMSIHDALYVCRRMQEAERREREILLLDFDPERHAVELWQTPGLRYACYDHDGRPVVLGGIREVVPGVGQTWMVSTDAWPSVVREVTRHCRRVLSALLETELHRVQTLSAAFHETAHRWFQMLKLEHEATFRAYGRGGEDFFLFARLREEA